MGSRSRCLRPLFACAFLTCASLASAAPPAPAKPAAKPATTPAHASPRVPASADPHASSPAKPGAKSAPAPASSSSAKTSSPAVRREETNVRRSVAGGPTYDDASVGADTPELRALHAAERELFPPASPALGSSWPSDLPFPVAAGEDRPRVHASGLPPAPPSTTPPSAEGGKDLSWLSKLDMPDLPVRWDARVVRYLEFFKDDPRGRSMISTWLRRSGRYRESIKKILRKKGLPEDLVYLAMIESGFEPVARSPVGAVGLWQFMPETGKIYGLSQDRWADMRMSLTVATEAAADFLADLHRRFGSWDLAMAGYNMGYGGVLGAVRRYNTNDFWALSKLEGSFPWETTLYVPKILAAAIVGRNLQAFGLQDLTFDPPIEGEEVPVAPGTTLATVAQTCGTTTKEVEALNPELRSSRTPPTPEDWPVKVPLGKSGGCAQKLAKAKTSEPPLERYTVRFGESLEQIAQSRGIAVSKLVELNAIAPGETVRGGTVILVPRGTAAASVEPKAPPAASTAGKEKPVVVVPQDMFVYPDRRRVFYRVQVGDTVREVCSTFKISADELRRWNEIDTSARLVEGMTLQIFAPSDADLKGVVVLNGSDVRTIVAGTDEFFAHYDDKGRRRIVVSAKAGDTLESIGKKHGVTTSMMERINRRPRTDVLTEGERVVVWAPGPSTPPPSPSGGAQATLAKPGPGPLPEFSPTPPLSAPSPQHLPALP
ncbi:MAG: LysM peptidoglycan-binding domain-containing protein [Deltaproteobacteria bacterium]|nr:LysM peptidoglycan-binding domain-containing protein [Deltaproteobacteria bacterium]